MDRFLAPTSPEALAHTQITENWFTWDIEHPSLNETLIAGCSTYKAFARFLSGNDLFILPRSRSELESILKRYSYDAIHNTISQARANLEAGGYSRICHLAETSISNVLNANDNVVALLALHPQPRDYTTAAFESSPSRYIRSN